VSSGRRQGRTPVVMPRNYLHGCLLLLIAESPAHGYDLVERLAALGLTTVDSAGVYRALRALDQDGLLESWWEESEAGPVRRRYRISARGVRTLEGWAATVGDRAFRLNAFLARHSQLRESRVLMTGNG
jgi:PadR family transcriptional regulator, regulatory protein PadR